MSQDSESSLITLEVGPACSQEVSKANGVKVKGTARPGSIAGKFQTPGSHIFAERINE